MSFRAKDELQGREAALVDVERAATRGAPAERRLTPIAVNIPDAAKIAGIGQSTIWQLIKDGKLDSRKVAGRRVIPYDALQALVLGEEQ
jgi:hypothetical protein